MGLEVYSLIRRTVKKLFGDVKISEEEIADIMVNDIIKREIINSEESKKAKKDIDKLYKKMDRIKEKSVKRGGYNSTVGVAEDEAESPDQDGVSDPEDGDDRLD
jgi:hypothetical protein